MHHGTPLLPPLANVGKLFKSTQTQPAQSNRINEIEHTSLWLPSPNWPIYRIKATTYLNKQNTANAHLLLC
jgi:hypothetical protein